MKLKQTLVFLLLLFIANSNAQILVKVNGKLITDKQVIKAEDIKKIEIAFNKTKPLKKYNGNIILRAELQRTADNYEVEGYKIVKRGETAALDFLSDTNTFYTLYEEGVAQKSFSINVDFWDKSNSLMKTLNNAASIPAVAKMQLDISLYFKEKIDEDEYGDPIDLTKIFTINIDNSTNLKPRNFKK